MRRAFFFIVAIVFASASFASIPRASALDPALPIAETLSETRVWASDVLAPFERPPESELTRALRQAYEHPSTTNASGLGRFLSVDPGRDWDMSKPQSWNMYAYVRNNPVNGRDPDGRAIDVLLDAGSAVYGIGVMWKKALNGEAVTWRDNAAVVVDLGAAFVPGLTGGGTVIRAAGKADDVVDAVRTSNIVADGARGRASEARVLDSMGLQKNTEKVTNARGSSIPDAQDATRVVEVKDTQRACDTCQMKVQREHAQQTGREHVVVTGTNTKVSKPLEKNSTIIRRDDLGPPQQ